MIVCRTKIARFLWYRGRTYNDVRDLDGPPSSNHLELIMYRKYPQTEMPFSADTTVLANIDLPGVNDVLRTNIRGDDCISVIKRWWNGLFLANPYDARCQNFYLSAHGIHRARYVQYTSFRNTIHPYSKFGFYWDCLMLFLYAFKKMFLLINISSVFCHNISSLYYAVAVAEIISIFDICICMKTCYIDTEQRRVVMSRTKILIRFLMYKLFYLAFMNVPLQCVFMIRYFGKDLSTATNRTNWFVCTLKFYNILTLVRLYELTNILKYECKRFWVRAFNSQLRIVFISCFTLFYFFSVTRTMCLAIILINNRVDRKSYHGHLILPMSRDHTQDTDYETIVSILRFIFSRTFLLYYDSRRHDLTEFGFIVLTVLVRYFFRFWLMADQFVIMTALNYVQETQTKLKLTTLQMLRRNHVSNDVSAKVCVYYEDPQLRPYFTECINGLYENLLYSLKSEIKLHRFSRIGRIKYFRRWPDDVLINFILLFQEDTYFAGDTVTQSHKPIDRFMVVDRGVLSVYSDEDVCTGHLIDNDYFGLLSLITDKEINISYVVALTHCMILTLDKYIFRTFMRKYPQLFFELKHRLLLEYPTNYMHNVDEDNENSNTNDPVT